MPENTSGHRLSQFVVFILSQQCILLRTVPLHRSQQKNYHSGVLQTRFPDRENALVILSDAFLSEFPMDITETK